MRVSAPASDKLILDVRDLYDTGGAASRNPAAHVIRNGQVRSNFTSVGNGVLLGTSVGTVTATQHNSGAGAYLITTSAADNGAKMTAYLMPIDKRWSLFPNRLADEKLYRYVSECVVWVETLPASSAIEVGICASPSNMTGFSLKGMAFRSFATTYGGNWHPFTNLDGANNIVGSDLGISPVVRRRFRFEYVEGTVPTLTGYIDGVAKLIASGEAAMPAYAAGQAFGLKVNARGGAGEKVYITDVSYKMYEQ